MTKSVPPTHPVPPTHILNPPYAPKRIPSLEGYPPTAHPFHARTTPTLQHSRTACSRPGLPMPNTTKRPLPALFRTLLPGPWRPMGTTWQEQRPRLGAPPRPWRRPRAMRSGAWRARPPQSPRSAPICLPPFPALSRPLLPGPCSERLPAPAPVSRPAALRPQDGVLSRRCVLVYLALKASSLSAFATQDAARSRPAGAIRTARPLPPAGSGQLCPPGMDPFEDCPNHLHCYVPCEEAQAGSWVQVGLPRGTRHGAAWAGCLDSSGSRPDPRVLAGD